MFKCSEEVYHLGQTYSELFVTENDPTQIQSIDFQWTHGVLNIFHSKLYIDKLEVDALSSHTSNSTSKPDVIQFCNEEATKYGAENGKDLHFKRC